MSNDYRDTANLKMLELNFYIGHTAIHCCINTFPLFSEIKGQSETEFTDI